MMRRWVVRLICCGRDAGEERFASWAEADTFRNSYTSGPGVRGPAGESGHERAGIISLLTVALVLTLASAPIAQVTQQKFRRDGTNGVLGITGPLVGGKLDCARATTCTSGGGSLPCDPCAGTVAWSRITGAPTKYPKAIEADVALTVAPTASISWGQIKDPPVWVTTTTVVGGPVTTSTAPSGGGGTGGGWTERPGRVETPKSVNVQRGYGRSQDVAIAVNGAAGYLSASGTVVTGLQAKPLRRWLQVEVGERYNGGGFPFSNGFSVEVVTAGQTGGEWPLGWPMIRRPVWTYRAGQKILAGTAGSETPGAQWHTVSACRTSSKERLSWCATTGCIQTDGACQFRRELIQPITFTDGAATFGPTWGADAYQGKPGFEGGSDTLNKPMVRASGGDNIDGKLRLDYPNADGSWGLYASMADSGDGWHETWADGDPREGTYESEQNILWNARAWKLGAGAAGGGLRAPIVPPRVTVVASPDGDLPAGEYWYAFGWEDETRALPTAAALVPDPASQKCSETPGCATITGPGQCLEVTIPEDADFRWPTRGAPGTVRAWVYAGTRDYWCMYVGSIERPAGVAGPGNDRLRMCSGDEIKELHTCNTVNRATRSVVLMGDPTMKPGPWRAGMPTVTGNTVVLEPGDVYPWVAEGVNCTADCSSCVRRYSVQGTAGSTKPNWNAVGWQMAFDGNTCWRRQPMIGHAFAVNGPTRVIKEPWGKLPYVVRQDDEDGTITWFNEAAPLPYLFPQVRLGRTGLVFYADDGVTPVRSYTAAGVQ